MLITVSNRSRPPCMRPDSAFGVPVMLIGMTIGHSPLGRMNGYERDELLLGVRSRTIFQAGEIVGGAKVYGGGSSEVPLVADGEVRILVPRSSADKFTGRIVYVGPLVAPVEAGSEVARLKIFRGTEQVLDLPLKSAAAVGQGSLPRRAMDAGIEYVTVFFRKYVLKK